MTKELEIYTIHSDGRIYSNKHKKFLAQTKDTKGYLRSTMWLNNRSKTCKVHRIIAECFLPKIEGKTCVNHKNGIKHDNRIENLEWVNNRENIIHAIENRLLSHNHMKKTVLDINTGVYYDSATELAKLLGINRVTLIQNLNGNRIDSNRYMYV